MKKQKIEEYPKIEDNMLEINLKQGLTNEEAINRQKKYGLNELKKTKKINPFLVYLSQFKDVLVIILLCASLLSYIFAIISGSKHNWNFNSELVVEFVEPSIILFVVLTNSLIGAIQEIKSAKAVDALSKLNPLQAKVVRNGVLVSIDSKDVTIGDVVMLEAGDVVPADGYLLFSSNLSAIESSLTGESEPSIKDYLSERDFSLPLADRKFMVYSSSIIATGTAYYVVSAIGSQTELGKISALVSQQKEAMSPLQIKINKLGKIFGYVGIALFLGSMLMQILFAIPNTSHYKELYFWSTVIVNGVSLAVAAIPEGLIAFTSIILAIGVQRMAKKKAVVKDLMAVESLGSCAVICSDKTGTLTQNKMTIVDLYNLENDKLTNSQMSNNYLKLIEFGSLCSEANLSFEDNEYKPVGDPTEVSFLYELEKYSQYKTKTELVSQYERIHVWPFDSDRKLMTSINKINDKFMVIVKGAPDVLINKTTLEKNNKEKVLKVNNEWANQAYRVLAIASKEISKKELDELFLKNNDYQLNYLENNLSFDGLVAMIDPPREEAKAAISICRQAGIKPVMITGDNINTAIAIAKSLNIYNDGDLAISGLELEKISDDELTNNIDKYSVYARVKPEDKLRIVNAWQKRNQVVAMTGDGVNDAPALKASDIGCAMGITGTEASKQAANMILADDNFTTIVSAVKNGRSIYQKIKNVIQNLLITSIAEVILVFLGLLIFKFVFKDWNELKGKEIYILSATQLLWINLFTHGFPAIALGLQNSKEDYMNKRPISKYESIFANGMGWNTLWQGIIIGILSMLGYYLGALWAKNNGDSGENIIRAASTIAFLVLGITATFNSINLMSKKPVIMSNPFYYWKVYASVIFSLFFLLLVAFINKISVVFKGYEQLENSPTLIAYGLGLPLILIPIYFIHKIILLLIEKKNQKQNTIKNFEMILTPRERKQAKK
ncbi:cation-translocating P-type ATPase [Mycoplasmopsis arginini]|uniref:cation-translocating P-type ATPase n=1 Tax=Mycoplasmopsis arginini TaxID=2094 RepID=UPI00227CEA7C|nr:cation-transporting P-type ATPase [Mycoplasmopsis arginini]MCY2902759.1 cation-transporting P-type ATPase [Mycoplasmopsis arginini QMP CG1-2758]MDI3348059.1 cation-transporting P-type ATPase [Mycoplasmopsis arginini]MDI3348646.1 cation-transporting P-type ATPase [Mycoplasmopsis arginini]MDI3351121.1 cation-transporting P-type ATPase [Mycoplasmopsis arginini]MDI3351674.1 cation-transporting P-type ATPase [Mycoplasmopsis arginini]